MAPERTTYIARLHWRTLASAVLLALAGSALFLESEASIGAWWAFLLRTDDATLLATGVEMVRAAAVTLLTVAGGLFLVRAIALANTRLTVTNRRLFLKTGALRSRSFELPLDRVEAIAVRQSPVARWLDYGTLIVSGTGSACEAVPFLSRPHECRRRIIEETEHQRAA